MAFALDASSALAWCFQDEATPFSAQLLTRAEAEELFVPAIGPSRFSALCYVAKDADESTGRASPNS